MIKTILVVLVILSIAIGVFSHDSASISSESVLCTAAGSCNDLENSNFKEEKLDLSEESHESHHQHHHIHDHVHHHHHEHNHDHDHDHHHHHEHDHHHHDNDHVHHHEDYEHHDHSDHEFLSSLPNSDTSTYRNPLLAISLTFVSGMAAMFGGVIVVLFGVPSNRLLGHMLSFAAGIMLFISYGDLLPHAIEDLGAFIDSQQKDHHDHDHHHSHDDHHGHDHSSGTFEGTMYFFVGMLFFCIVATLIPHGLDAESGHSHSHGSTGVKSNSKGKSKSKPKSKKDKDSDAELSEEGSEEAISVESGRSVSARRLMITGLVAAAGISLHNLPEGLIVFNQTIGGICSSDSLGEPWHFSLFGYSVDIPIPTDLSSCLSRGLAITLAIGLHNIPEGMAVASPIYASTGSRYQALKYTLISSLFEPLAAAVFGLFYYSFLTPDVLGRLNGAVAGVMVALVVTELIPSATELISSKEAAFSNVLGQVVMFLSLHFMRSAGMH